jgi:GMC oxidoreductase
MGRGENMMTVVDTEFRVRAVKGLRVVDCSIAPLVANNHTQSFCYLIKINYFEARDTDLINREKLQLKRSSRN